MLATSILLYLAACAMPALLFRNRNYADSTHWTWGGYRSVSGIQLLVQGIVFGWLQLNFSAFANVPLWLSWIFFGRRSWRAARTAALVALIMSLETFSIAAAAFVVG